jgi:hypothetical protein
VRSYNCLKREGIHTVGELIGRSEQDLLDIRNFGAKSIDEVKAQVVEMGLSLKDSAPGFDPHAAWQRTATKTTTTTRPSSRTSSRLKPTTRLYTRYLTRPGRNEKHMPTPRRAPPRRQPRAPTPDLRQPGHLALRARPDHHHRDRARFLRPGTRRS